MGFFSSLSNGVSSLARNVASTVTFGAVDSTATVASKKATRRMAKQARHSRMRSGVVSSRLQRQDDKFDKQLDKLEKKAARAAKKSAHQEKMFQRDIARVNGDMAKNMNLDKKQARQINTLEVGLRSYKKANERRLKSVSNRIAAVDRGIAAEEREAARVAGDLQAALMATPGGAQMAAVVQKALQDKRIDHSELTEFVTSLAMWVSSSFENFGEEFAEGEAALEQINATLESVDHELDGIATNAGAISALVTHLGSLGYIDVGDMKENIANGSVFFRGRKFPLVEFILNLVLVKSCRLHVMSAAKENKEEINGKVVRDMFFSPSTPAILESGKRQIKETDDLDVTADDLYGLRVVDGNMILLGADEIKPGPGGARLWAIGDIVTMGGEARIAPNMASFVKVFGAFGITTFDKFYTTLLPLASETISGLFTEAGIDIASD